MPGVAQTTNQVQITCWGHDAGINYGIRSCTNEIVLAHVHVHVHP